MVSKLLLLKLEVEELSGLKFITKQVEHNTKHLEFRSKMYSTSKHNTVKTHNSLFLSHLFKESN
jgi:hypothetical protein